MRHQPSIILIAVSFIYTFSHAQHTIPEEAFDYYPTLKEMYGYAFGVLENKTIVFGGRVITDVPELSNEDFPNTEILIIDHATGEARAYNSMIVEGQASSQLSSFGMAFYQESDELYLIGGYGFSEVEQAFITFPMVTKIQLSMAIQAIEAGEAVEPFILTTCEDRLALFDGSLTKDECNYYHSNGKKAYKKNPFDWEPEYIEQSFEGEIRTFMLEEEQGTLKILEFQEWYDLQMFRDHFTGPIPMSIQRVIDEQKIDLLDQ